MPETTTPETSAIPGPIGDAFSALARLLAEHGLARSDAGDDAGLERALNFRAAVRGMADRWAAGEASATRRQPRKQAEG